MNALTINYKILTEPEHPQMKELLDLARQSAEQAYSPYSKFQVGCAILLENGEIVLGNNQENVAYPSGLCAERVAIFFASAKFPKIPIVAIAIRAFSKEFLVDRPITPCGACRQVLLEYQMLQKNQGIPIYMQGEGAEILCVTQVQDLLPFAFFEEKLNT